MRKQITKLMAIVAVILLGVGSVNGQTTIHEPGIYTKAQIEGGYGQTLTTFTVNEVAREYEIYGAKRGADSNSPSFVAGGNNGYTVATNTSLSSLTGDWFVATTISSTQTATSTPGNQFSTNSIGHWRFQSENGITLKVKGYDEIAFVLKDNGTGAGKFFTVTINGMLQTMTASTSISIRSFNLQSNIENTIVLAAGTAASNHEFHGFALRLANDVPTLKLTSGSIDQTIEEGDVITDITYTYGATANDYTIAWVGTANESTPPAGISVSKDASAKTVTISNDLLTSTVIGSYEYTIKATDGTNYSSALTGTIMITPPVPLDLQLAGLDCDNVSLSWDAANNATSYNVNYCYSTMKTMVETFDNILGGSDAEATGDNSDLDNPSYFYSTSYGSYAPKYKTEVGALYLTNGRFLIKVDDPTQAIQLTLKMKSEAIGGSSLMIYKKASTTGTDRIETISVSDASYADYSYTIPANTLEEADGAYYFQLRAESTSNAIYIDEITVKGEKTCSSSNVTTNSVSLPVSSLSAGMEYSATITALSGTIESEASNTVTFIPGCFSLSLSANDVAYGSVSADPNLTSYLYGTLVTLTATPETNYIFSSWDGVNGVDVDIDNKIIMDEDKVVVANFGLASSIASTTSSKTIASEEFYTLTGVQIPAADASGIYIKKITFEDGSVETVKFIK